MGAVYKARFIKYAYERTGEENLCTQGKFEKWVKKLRDKIVSGSHQQTSSFYEFLLERFNLSGEPIQANNWRKMHGKPLRRG